MSLFFPSKNLTSVLVLKMSINDSIVVFLGRLLMYFLVFFFVLVFFEIFFRKIQGCDPLKYQSFTES